MQEEYKDMKMMQRINIEHNIEDLVVLDTSSDDKEKKLITILMDNLPYDHDANSLEKELIEIPAIKEEIEIMTESYQPFPKTSSESAYGYEDDGMKNKSYCLIRLKRNDFLVASSNENSPISEDTGNYGNNIYLMHLPQENLLPQIQTKFSFDTSDFIGKY